MLVIFFVRSLKYVAIKQWRVNGKLNITYSSKCASEAMRLT